MSTPSPTPDGGQARRLLVTFAIAATAAAVTAGVALNERHPGDAVVQRAEAHPAIAGAATPAPARYRRDQWRDPWKHAPLSESVSTSITVANDAALPTDPSLPPAADALKGAAEPSADAAPTF